MQYAAAIPFRGNTDHAFGLAESALAAIGFRIVERTAGGVTLVGPGMNNSRESALVGASRIRLISRRGELAVEAELGGVERMARFVTLFPPALCLFLAIGLTGLFSVRFGPGAWLVAVMTSTGGVAAVWLVLGRWMARSIRARTCRGLDTLLASMVAVGEAP